MYEALIKDNKEKALELYKYVKNEKHNMPGEMIDFYRIEAYIKEFQIEKSENIE